MRTPASGAGPQGSRPVRSAATRSLRTRTDLKQLKRQAKDLLKGFQAGDDAVVAEVNTHYHDADSAAFALSDAQLVIARAYGLESWPKLVEKLGSPSGEGGPAFPSGRMKVPFHMAGRPWLRESVAVDGDQAWSLFRACADGDEAQVQSLIAGEPDLTHAQVWYNKPVDYAIRENHIGVVGHLLEADAGHGLWSCVYVDHYAIGRREVLYRGYEQMDRLLIDYQLERAPRFSPAFGNLAGHIQARDFSLVTRALRNRELLHASDIAGNGPLHHAVRMNAFDIVEHLVEAGADIDVRNARGATPLDLSLKEAEVTSYLVSHGASWTLGAAARVGHLEKAKALLQQDPGAARRLDSEEASPLMHAVRGDHIHIVQLLLDHGADPNAPERGAPHGAALYTAAVLDRRAILDLLLAKGAHPDATMDSSGPAISWGKPTVKRALSAAGALEFQPWALDASGSREPGWAQGQMKTSLSVDHPVIYDGDEYRSEGGWGSFVHCVCHAGDVDILDLYVAKVGTERLHELTSRHCQSSNPDFIDRLIHHGVHPDNRDWYGRTALHYAAENGDTAAAERWIDNGADVNAVDVRESTTALGYAARKGHAEMVRLLLDKGADPAAPADREWARPAVYAELEGNRDVADLLGTA